MLSKFDFYLVFYIAFLLGFLFCFVLFFLQADCTQSEEEKVRFEQLCEEKVEVVEERNGLVMLTEDERLREMEEEEMQSNMMDQQFGALGT